VNLQNLLGDVPLAEFVGNYYQRLPYSAAGAAVGWTELGTWESLLGVLSHASADVLVCRRNEQHSGPTPRTSVAACGLVEEGFTLLVRHAERHCSRLAKVAAAFAADFAAPVNVHMYCTPGGEFGFGWHYDAEEVFIVQTTGRKEYLLRKNTVNPWPIEETLPADMHYEREIMPLVRCELAAGDWLYIPSGYWHRAQSRETAISLAIGVQPRTGIDAFDCLRPQLIESLLWRQRLPVAGAAAGLSEEELRQQYRIRLAELGQDLARLLADPAQADRLIASLRSSSGPSSAEESPSADNPER
jgi:ribosomal protein L16 Arg81 hydroxylase